MYRYVDIYILYITSVIYIYITTTATILLLLISPSGSAADIVMMAMIKLWKSQVLKDLGNVMLHSSLLSS